ncbi:MAG: TonB-dependent receptor plug domain-containing protein [Lutibacter sp.]|nr:TonB-dependent receptor plug domain-containing protein [Lutibacter sp.]
MRINKRQLLLILTCFLYSFFNYAQGLNKEAKPLFEILAAAEKQFQITFTYANQVIETIEIAPYPKNLNLTEVLIYFKKNTPLTFTFLTKTNILISKQNDKNSICGYLMDVNSGNYIEGALISVLKTNISTVSNANGYFKIDGITENQVIEVSSDTYPAIYLNASKLLAKKSCLTISLAQKIERLHEVMLNNYLTSGITVNTNNTITIDAQNSGILPGLIEPDILQKIQALPGIGSINESISNINIRGGANDQNLLLWDGIKMYHSGHFFGLISAFDPYLVDKVTIVKNGTSTQYNDGVSGTIIIETLDSIHKKPFGGAGFNLLSTDAYAQIPISEKVAVQFSVRRAITDLIKTPTFDQYFKKAFQDSKITTSNTSQNEFAQTDSKFNFYDYSFKLLYNLNKKNNIRLSFLNVENKLHFNETLQTETVLNSKTSELEQRNIAVGLLVTNKWNNKFKTTFHSYYTKYDVHAENFSLLNEQRLIQKNEVLETGLKLNSYYKLTENIQLLNGYHFYELGITNSEDVNLPIFIRTIKNVIRNHSLFSEVNYASTNNRTFVNSGLRLNYVDKFRTFIAEPRVQALQKLNANLSLKIAGEYKSQNATQIIDLQEDFLGVEKTRWTLADNDAIPILKSKQASFGINYKKNNFFIDIEGFYKYVNGITTANQGFQNQHQFIKTSGSYIVKGIEFLINKKTDAYSTWLSYTFNENNYNFPQLSPAVFPNNLDIKHSISFGNTYTYKKLNFALGLLWRTGKPHTTPTQNDAVTINGATRYINYNAPNSNRLSNYFRADFSSTYQFNLSEKVNGMIGISILNLFNNKNILNTYYKINDQNAINTINNSSIDTAPNFTFRMYF